MMMIRRLVGTSIFHRSAAALLIQHQPIIVRVRLIHLNSILPTNNNSLDKDPATTTGNLAITEETDESISKSESTTDSTDVTDKESNESKSIGTLGTSTSDLADSAQNLMHLQSLSSPTSSITARLRKLSVTNAANYQAKSNSSRGQSNQSSSSSPSSSNYCNKKVMDMVQERNRTSGNRRNYFESSSSSYFPSSSSRNYHRKEYQDSCPDRFGDIPNDASSGRFLKRNNVKTTFAKKYYQFSNPRYNRE